MIRDGAFGILIGAAVGTLFLVPAHGSAQRDPRAQVFRADPCSSATLYTSRWAALIGCAATGYAPDQYALGLLYAEGHGSV